MGRRRLYDRYSILLLVSVVLICVVFAVVGYSWLRRGAHGLMEERARHALQLSIQTAREWGDKPQPGSRIATPLGTVSILSLPQFRREFGIAGDISTPLEYQSVRESRGGQVFVLARSWPESNSVIVSETPLDRLDALLGDAIVTFLLATLLVVLATAGFSVAAIRSLGNSIYRLEGAVRHFSAGNLRHRVLVDDPPALAAFARTLNGLAAQFHSNLTRVTQQKNELETILSSMVEGVLVLDTKRQISAINQAAALLFAVDPTKAKGQSVIAMLRNSEVDDFAEETLSAEEPKERTITLFDAEPIHVQLHGTVLRGEDGATIGALIVTSDVTRLKRLETVRREFVANVSHELRTPITSILGFVETLQEGALDDRERASRFLGIIYAHANRLNLIIEDLLSLSRLESYESTIPVQKCQIHDIINSTKLAVASAAMQKNIDVNDSYSGPTEVLANATLLEQAIRNLVDNAVKYSPDDTTVRISVKNRDGTLSVEVTDEGAGIRSADLPRIFERFYRVDRARSRDLGGTGLGLAIVKHIAIAHGGNVNVESVPGTGSTFTLSIPQNWEGS